jgi:hypothetical protein
MQIGGKGLENLLMNMVLEKKKNLEMKRHLSMHVYWGT